MTKKINKPELAILNDDFVTVASQILNSLLLSGVDVAVAFGGFLNSLKDDTHGDFASPGACFWSKAHPYVPTISREILILGSRILKCFLACINTFFSLRVD